MITIRRLDPNSDGPLFESMFTWLAKSPEWYRECAAVWGDLSREAYLAATYADHRVDVGVFADGVLVADIILTAAAPAIYEVHLEANPAISPKVVVQAGWAVRDLLFEDYATQLLYIWVPRFNRSVRAINKALGFQPDNVTMWRGTYRGKLIEWWRYSMTGDTNGRH